MTQISRKISLYYLKIPQNLVNKPYNKRKYEFDPKSNRKIDEYKSTEQNHTNYWKCLILRKKNIESGYEFTFELEHCQSI